jgi:hypothetical protein
MTTLDHYIYTIKNRIVDPMVEESWSTLDYANPQELAETKLVEVRKICLEQNKELFHVIKVVQNNIGEVWLRANIEEEPENGDYKVIDHTTGLYDSFTNLTDVKNNILQKQELFIKSMGIDKVVVTNNLQPKVEGMKTA